MNVLEPHTASPYAPITDLSARAGTLGGAVIAHLLRGDDLVTAADQALTDPHTAALAALEAADAVAATLRRFVDPDAVDPAPLPRRCRPA